MSKIKILHTEWSTGFGGQEIRIINESLALRELGCEVAIACRKDAKIKKAAEENNIEVFELAFKSNKDLVSVFKLKKIIQEQAFNILNSHSGIDSWIGGFAAKLAGIKFIRTRHLTNKINSSRFNFINEMADFVITVGESIKDNMIKNNRIHPSKIASIPTGSDAKIFNPKLYDKKKAQDFFNLDPNFLYVGNLAVLRAPKRHDIYLNIASKIHKKHKNVIFLIAGVGDEEERLKARIEKENMGDFVKMLGFVDKVPEFLSAIDISMSTSAEDGLSQSLTQALLMQKPSIATNVGSIKDGYDGSNFLLVDFDEDKLYEALDELLINKELFESLKNNEQKFIKENFEKNNMQKKVYEIYKKVLSQA